MSYFTESMSCHRGCAVSETPAETDEAVITETPQAPNAILITDPRGLLLGENQPLVLSMNRCSFSHRREFLKQYFSFLIFLLK